MEEIKLQASNIKCGGCVSNVENGLKDMQGIETIKVDIDSNIVTIGGNNIDTAAVSGKLTELGYPVIS